MKLFREALSLRPDTKQLRSFGLIFGVLLAVIFGLVLPWLFAFSDSLVIWYVALGFITVALLYAPLLLFPYRVWMLVGSVLGRVNSFLILTIVFFLLFVPFSLIFKLFGKDPLNRKFEPKLTTYRIMSNSAEAERLKEPF